MSLGKELYTLQEHKQAVMDVKFHPTKVQAISASADKSLVHVSPALTALTLSSWFGSSSKTNRLQNN